MKPYVLKTSERKSFGYFLGRLYRQACDKVCKSYTNRLKLRESTRLNWLLRMVYTSLATILTSPVYVFMIDDR